MKRSEMINIIASYMLKEQTINFFKDEDTELVKNALSLAEDALDAAEAAGMLPPSYPTYNSGIAHYPNEWEPENETK